MRRVRMSLFCACVLLSAALASAAASTPLGAVWPEAFDPATGDVVLDRWDEVLWTPVPGNIVLRRVVVGDNVTVRFADVDQTVHLHELVVFPRGALQAGSPEAAFGARLRLVFHGARNASSLTDPETAAAASSPARAPGKGLLAYGSVFLRGREMDFLGRTLAVAHLAESAPAGASVLRHSSYF